MSGDEAVLSSRPGSPAANENSLAAGDLGRRVLLRRCEFGLQRSELARRAGGRLRGGDPTSGSHRFPRRQCVQTVTTTTSSALAAHPAAEAQRLTKDLRRVLTGTSRS